MKVVMKKYTEMCKKGTKKNFMALKNFNVFFSRYEAMLSLFNSINTLLFVPVFLLSVFHATALFFGITIFLQSLFLPILIFLTLTSF